MRTLHPFLSDRDHPARRGCPAVPAGTRLYAVYSAEHQRYFIWCYLSREFAERMLPRACPRDAVDLETNWRRSTRDLLPSSRSDFS